MKNNDSFGMIYVHRKRTRSGLGIRTYTDLWPRGMYCKRMNKRIYFVSEMRL